MKILQLTYSLSSGGAEHFVVDLCNKLSQNRNNEVYLLTLCDDRIPHFDHYHKELSPNIHYLNAGAKSGFTLKSIISIYKTIKQLKPDIVHAHFSTLLLYFFAFFLKDTIYIHTLHNLPSACLRFKNQKYINYFFFRNKLIYPITISCECHKEFFEIYKQEFDIQIDNGRSPINTSESVNAVKEEIESYKSNPDDIILLHVARCAPQKNQDMLLKVFNKLTKEGVHAQLIMIGSGYNKNHIRNQNKNVHVLGEKKNVGDYMKNSDFFILSSLYEGLPLSLLEAMSIGCVPICTPVGGIVDVIENNKTGFLSKSTDEKDFYFTIKYAICNKKQIDKCTIISEYNKRFSMELCAKKYYELYLNKIKEQR